MEDVDAKVRVLLKGILALEIDFYAFLRQKFEREYQRFKRKSMPN